MKVNDALLGLALLVLAIGLWVGCEHVPESKPAALRPSALPELSCRPAGDLPMLLMVTGWRERGAGPLIAFAPWTRNRISVVRFLSVPVAVAGYVFLVEILGFLPIATLVLLLLFALSRRSAQARGARSHSAWRSWPTPSSISVSACNCPGACSTPIRW